MARMCFESPHLQGIGTTRTMVGVSGELQKVQRVGEQDMESGRCYPTVSPPPTFLKLFIILIIYCYD